MGLTLSLERVSIFPKSTQWAAVNTQFGATRVPPQKCSPLTCSEATQGNSCVSVSVPSTIWKVMYIANCIMNTCDNVNNAILDSILFEIVLPFASCSFLNL